MALRASAKENERNTMIFLVFFGGIAIMIAAFIFFQRQYNKKK